MSSLLTLNYFTPFPSFPIVDFEQVNVCWENYLTFYSFDICFNAYAGGGQNLTRNNAGNSVIFLILFYFILDTHCNLSKPSIIQMIHSRNTGKFV